jgi:fructose-1,6-bisphosphatase/inositol monophosphatase family enzyme
MNIEEIISVVKDAGDIMLSAKRPRIMEKSGHANFCTETDEKIQAFLVEKLKKVIPDAEFLGEEDGQDVFSSKMSSGFCFVIDPIDGTSNFIYEYRPSVISVGLLKDARPHMAVVFNPYEDMMFWAEDGKGCPKDDKKAVGWYVKAAQAKNGNAMYRLGYFYSKGLMGLKQSQDKAYEMFKHAKANGCTMNNIDEWLNVTKPIVPKKKKSSLWGGSSGDDLDDLLRDLEAGN